MPSTKKEARKKKHDLAVVNFRPFFSAEFLLTFICCYLVSLHLPLNSIVIRPNDTTPHRHTYATHTTPCRMLCLDLYFVGLGFGYSYLLTDCLTLSHIELSLAYETLSKPSSRFVYDSTGGSSGKSMLGSDETLQSVLSQVFFEFMDGDFEVIRNMISKWLLQSIGDMVLACSRHAQLNDD